MGRDLDVNLRAGQHVSQYIIDLAACLEMFVLPSTSLFLRGGL